MGLMQLRSPLWGQQWHAVSFPVSKCEGDKAGHVAALYGLRIISLGIATLIWIVFTLSTSLFTVAPVILIGLTVGCSHLLLPNVFNRAHLPSAIYITLFGSLLANLMAGLAMFSSTMGVDYQQVVSSRRIPEDLAVLGSVFVDAFRTQDAIFYLLAIAASTLCLRKKTDLSSSTGGEI